MLRCLFYTTKGIPMNSGAIEIGHQNRWALGVRDCTQFDATHYFSIFRYLFIIFRTFPWACSRGGECNGYGYPIHYSLFSHIPFSTIVYIYLQRHFSPLTTTTVHTFAIFTIERGPVYLWELRCKVSPKPITPRHCEFEPNEQANEEAKSAVQGSTSKARFLPQLLCKSLPLSISALW